jgi:hypothetical protein
MVSTSRVIQAPEPGPRIMRYELTDYEWTATKPFPPNKPRGVPRVNDRRVLNGIFWALRSGAPWRDLPDNFGPHTTCYNRFVRWRRAGVWSCSGPPDGVNTSFQIIHSSSRGCHDQQGQGRLASWGCGIWSVERNRLLRFQRHIRQDV